jgi:hypothetical protein
MLLQIEGHFVRRTTDGVAPKPHFQFAPEEGSEGLLAPAEVRCRCLEES